MEQLKKGQARLLKSALALLLTLFLACGMLALPAMAAIPPLVANDVIYHYPITPSMGTDVIDVTWNGGFAHPGGSDPYISPPPAKHVDITTNKVTFYGYGSLSALDYVFSQGQYLNWGNTFTIVPDSMRAHSLGETGYLFNGAITIDTSVTPNKHYYTGYALVIRPRTDSAMTSGTPFSIILYYMNNVLDIRGEEFKLDSFIDQRRSDGVSPYTNVPGRTIVHEFVPTGTGVVPVLPAIPDNDKKQYKIDVEIDPLTRAFSVKVDVLDAAGNPLPDANLDGVGDGDIPAYQELAANVLGPATQTGFGFYTGYFNHSCNIQTVMSYDNIQVRVYDIQQLTAAKSTVNFLAEGTSAVLCAPVSRTDGYATQKYKVTPPPTLEIGGVTWTLVRSSRGVLTGGAHDNLEYQTADADNVTNVYYERKYSVTEKWLIDGTTTQVDATNYPDKVRAGLAAGVAISPSLAPPKTIGDYTYYGYRIDGGTVVTGEPPAVTAVLIASLGADSTISYLYKKNTPPPEPAPDKPPIIPIPIIAPIVPIVPIIDIDFDKLFHREKKPDKEVKEAVKPPKTGDNSMTIALVAALGLGLAMAGAVAMAPRKRKLED